MVVTLDLLVGAIGEGRIWIRQKLRQSVGLG